MNLGKSQRMPVYNDGYFELYDIVDDPDGDFPEKKIKKRDIGKIYFRELAIFDRTQEIFQQDNKQATAKLAIPQWDGISSDCVIVIDGKQHKVFNCAPVISKQGYRETEITCINPEMEYEVME